MSACSSDIHWTFHSSQRRFLAPNLHHLAGNGYGVRGGVHMSVCNCIVCRMDLFRWFGFTCLSASKKWKKKMASRAPFLTRRHFKHKTMNQHFKRILTLFYVLHLVQLVVVSWFLMYQIKKSIPPCCMYHSVTILRNTLIFFLCSLMIELHLHHLCLSKADHENSNV